MKTFANKEHHPAAPAVRRNRTGFSSEMVFSDQCADIRRVIGAPLIQAQLKVSQPDDPDEKEADRVADQVMRMPDPGTPLPSV